MKRILCIFLTLCMLLCGAAMAQETAAFTQDVVVLFTSDVHCGVDQGFGYVGCWWITATPYRANRWAR